MQTCSACLSFVFGFALNELTGELLDFRGEAARLSALPSHLGKVSRLGTSLADMDADQAFEFGLELLVQALVSIGSVDPSGESMAKSTGRDEESAS